MNTSRSIRNTLGYFLPLLTACGEKQDKISQLKTLRTPIAQFWVKSPTPGGAGCKVFSGQNYCQQTPLRPAATTGEKAYVTFIAISPRNEPIDFKLTKIEQITVLGENVTGAKSQEISLSTFGLSTPAPTVLIEELQQTPMRIQQFGYEITIPTLQSLVDARQFPLYTFRYVATAPNLESDTGSVSISLLPDPEDNNLWDALQRADTRVDPAIVARVRSQARKNTPPTLGDISPNSLNAPAIEVSDATDVSVPEGPDKDLDPNAKRRIQWYVTQGTVDNERSSATRWKFDGTGPAGAFVAIRDLQGGSDFKFTSVVVK